MRTIYTIGFTKKTAEEFFNILRNEGIKRIIDIRLSNIYQISGFTKRKDLEFFTKELLGGEYIYLPELAPNEEIREIYDKEKDWDKYTKMFLNLMKKRQVSKKMKIWQNLGYFDDIFVLLCSEPSASECHRSIIAALVKKCLFPDAEIKHL